jgi:MtN3 and saliva related transmembrane protein
MEAIREGAQPFGVEETTMAGVRWGVDKFNKATPIILLPCIMVLCGCQDLVPHDTQSLLDPNLKRSEVLGLVAGFGTTFAAVPDLIAMFRRRSSAGMNPRMAAIMGVFQILWVYYGLLIVSRPVIIWNVVAVLVNFVSVGAYFYFVGKEKRPQHA